MAIAGGVPGQANKAPDADAAHADPKSQSTTIVQQYEYNAPDHTDKPHPDPPQRYAALKDPNTWLVVVGFLTFGAVLYQSIKTATAAEAALQSAQAANAQIKTMKDMERARLMIRLVTDPDVGKPAHILNGGCPLRVFFFAENIGKSRAFNARASGVIDFIHDPEKGTHQDGFFQDFPQIIDEGKQHRISLAGFGIEFEDDGANGDFLVIQQGTAAKLREGKELFIQASGLLTYEDIFGDPHRTPFRLVWKSRGDDAGGVWLTRSAWVDYSPDST